MLNNKKIQNSVFLTSILGANFDQKNSDFQKGAEFHPSPVYLYFKKLVFGKKAPVLARKKKRSSKTPNKMSPQTSYLLIPPDWCYQRGICWFEILPAFPII